VARVRGRREAALHRLLLGLAVLLVLGGCSSDGNTPVGDAIDTGDEDDDDGDDIDVSEVDICTNLTRLLTSDEPIEGEVFEKLTEEVWAVHPEELREQMITMREFAKFAEEAEDATSSAELPPSMIPVLGDMEFAYNDLVFWMTGNCELATPPWACLGQAPSSTPIFPAEGGGTPSPEEAAGQLVGPDRAPTLVEKARTDAEVTFQMLDTDGLATDEVTVVLAADGTWLPSSWQVCYSPRGDDAYEPTNEATAED
jgi:hypothetical protein